MIFSSTRSGWSVTVLGYMEKVRVVLFDGRLEKLIKIISPTPFWAKLLISLIVSITALVNAGWYVRKGKYCDGNFLIPGVG